MPNWTALVTLLAIFAYLGAGIAVGQARTKYNIQAPATTGHPIFERLFRAHQNMLEWMPIFLPVVWLFAIYVSDRWAAASGLLWIFGRIRYMIDYKDEPRRRTSGYAIQSVICLTLALGALIAVVRQLLNAG